MDDDARRDVDPSKLSLAGAYNYITGGTDNTLTDREAVNAFEERWPGLPLNAVENSKFLRRVVAFFAEQGIRQILDLGAGKPKPGPGSNVHELLAEHTGDGRVVYVEKDPTAHSHARAMWGSGTGGANTAYIEADVRDAGRVVGAVRSSGLLDLDEPVGVLMLAVLHYIDAAPAEVVAPYADSVAPGSLLAVTHMASEGAPKALMEDLQDVFGPVGGAYIRPRAEVEAAFQGWEPIEPGLVEVRDWRPVERVEHGPLALLAGVARKPA